MEGECRPMRPGETLTAFMGDFLAGSVSSAIAKTATAPLERAKILLQTLPAHQGGSLSPTQRTLLVLRQQGFFALWRGNLANVIRYFPNQSLSLAVKDRFRHAFLGPNATEKQEFWKVFWGSLAAGGLAGGVTLAGTYPLDLVRTVMAGDISHTTISQQTVDPKARAPGIVASMRVVYEDGASGVKNNKFIMATMPENVGRVAAGIAGLYRGFAVSLLLVVVYRGLHFGGYDIAKDLYLRYSKKQNSKSASPSLNMSFGFAWGWSLILGSAVYPFDTARRRLMIQKRLPDGTMPYNGAVDCVRKIVREEGLGALFRGVGVNMARSLGGAITLVAYDKLKVIIAAAR